MRGDKAGVARRGGAPLVRTINTSYYFSDGRINLAYEYMYMLAVRLNSINSSSLLQTHQKNSHG